MKNQIITGIGTIACVALCAAVWPRGTDIGNLSVKPVKAAVTAEIGVRSEETQQIILSADTLSLEMEPVAESEPEEAEITAEKETQKSVPTQAVQSAKPSASSSEPRMGDVRIFNGEKQIYIDGFGWIKDEGGGGQGTMVGNPGDELTGNKVGIMGGGTTVDGKGDINKQVGVMDAGNILGERQVVELPQEEAEEKTA